MKEVRVFVFIILLNLFLDVEGKGRLERVFSSCFFFDFLVVFRLYLNFFEFLMFFGLIF